MVATELTGRNLGRVLTGHARPCPANTLIRKTAQLKVENYTKQLLGSILLALTLPSCWLYL